MKKQPSIYMDYAAATPLDPAVLAAMQPYFSEQFYNPSALYLAAKDAKQAVEDARRKVAQVLGARPGEIVFTAGGTEANNVAIHGVMAHYPGKKLIISAIEHESVRETARQYDCTEAPVNGDGRINLEKLESLIDDDTVLVSVMYANNEIGTIQPIKEIAQHVATIRKQRQQAGNDTPLLFHTDACQASNSLDLHTARLGVDFMTINGGKIYGPKQSGALFVRAGIVLEPLIHGGGQEANLRSGTENVPAIVGFAQALEIAQEQRADEAARLRALQRRFLERVEDKLPAVQINGSRKHRLPNNIHITVPGHDNERLLMELDERGIMCATGSACSASKEEASHVLTGIGLTPEEARSSLRFTMGRGTTEAEVRTTVDTLAKIVAK